MAPESEGPGVGRRSYRGCRPSCRAVRPCTGGAEDQIRGHNADVSRADLTLSGWLDLSDEAAGRTAAAIARSTGARLAGVGADGYAGRTGRAAFFDRDGIRYALVPGGTVQLGHDADRFVPSAR